MFLYNNTPLLCIRVTSDDVRPAVWHHRMNGIFIHDGFVSQYMTRAAMRGIVVQKHRLLIYHFDMYVLHVMSYVMTNFHGGVTICGGSLTES